MFLGIWIISSRNATLLSSASAFMAALFRSEGGGKSTAVLFDIDSKYTQGKWKEKISSCVLKRIGKLFLSFFGPVLTVFSINFLCMLWGQRSVLHLFSFACAKIFIEKHQRLLTELKCITYYGPNFG